MTENGWTSDLLRRFGDDARAAAKTFAQVANEEEDDG